MGRRRQWGSVRKLPSGRYQARLPDGSPAPDTFPTKAEASRWLSLAEADLLRGTFVHPSLNGNITVAEWLQEWRASHSLHKRPTTLARDESAIHRHLIPRLGPIQLVKLRPTDVQAFVADLRGEVGPGTTRSIYGVLRAALNAAVNAELLARSPARGIKLPQVPKTDVVTLRPEERHRLAAALPHRWQPMAYVAGACGLRFSEVAGLRVARVDLARLRLQVLETAPQAGGDRAEPKTAAGRRTVPEPGPIAEVLDEHLTRYGLTREPDALVFSAERGGALTPPTGTNEPGYPLDRPPGYPG
jgi:integrase